MMSVGHMPTSFNEAVDTPEAPKWHEAMEEEISSDAKKPGS